MPKDYSEIDRIILEVIRLFEGIPNPRNLSSKHGGPIKYSSNLISKRVNSNSVLMEALESRGIQFVQTCDRETFSRSLSTGKWKNVTGVLKEKIWERVDGHIIQAIQSFKGVPNRENICSINGGPLKYGKSIIFERVKKNPIIILELEKRGIEFIKNCDQKEFYDSISSGKWGVLKAKVKDAANERLDKDILRVIKTCSKVPTYEGLTVSYGGTIGCSHSTIKRRVQNNPELLEAFEAKGVDFVLNCGRQIFNESLATGLWSNATPRVRDAIHERLDQIILDTIQSFEGVPSGSALSQTDGGPLPFVQGTVSKRIKKNPLLRKAVDEKGSEFIRSCDIQTFVKYQLTWFHISPKIDAEIHARTDKIILETIPSFEGIPTPFSLSKESGGPLPFSYAGINRRMKKNPELQKAAERRGVEFVENCDLSNFRSMSIGIRPGKIRDAINRRLDKEILQTIESYDGVPTLNNISKEGGGPLNISFGTIAERAQKNPKIEEAIDQKGLEYVRTCDRKTFDGSIAALKWTNVPKKIKQAINERIDGIILEEIGASNGVLTMGNLSAPHGANLTYSNVLLMKRFEENPALSKAMEQRGIAFVESCDRKTFDDSVSTIWGNVTGKVREKIDERLNENILEAIQDYPGVPTVYGLSKEGGGPLCYGDGIIKERIKTNKQLQNALVKRGVEFVTTCERAIFDEYITSLKWGGSITGIVRKAIDKRLDQHILEAINSLQKISSLNSLSTEGGGPLAYGRGLVERRINRNPDLRREYYIKKGLTEDRINALEAEHDVPGSSFVESIKRRLPNTRIFRESLGILKQFRSIFGNKEVLEVSFYPEPLQRAANMLGIHTSSEYLRAHKLKRTDFRFESDQQFDSIAMLQFFHRLNDESLVNILNEANRILVEAGALLISLPHEYSRTYAFESQVQNFGFELKTEGTLYTRTLGIEELAALGIEDPERLKQKVEQATNLIMLVKTIPATGQELDGFVPAKRQNGNGIFVPSMDEINTPEELLHVLDSVFQKKTPGLAEGFILTVLDDSRYDERHLVGYGMNPGKTLKLEVWSHREAALKQEEMRKLSSRILDSSFQERILVRPGRETRVPSRMVKNALSR